MANIAALDYNTIRNKIIALLGPGTAQRGYGQPISSSAVSTGNTITQEHWDKLRYDLTNIKLHQDGVNPPIVTLTPGAVIRYGAGHPNTNYSTLADQADLARFNIGVGQSILSSKGSTTYTSAWSTAANATLTITFSTAAEARYFFNSGGKIQFSSSRAGGAVSAQNTSWTNLLSTVGTVSFGGATPSLANFYTLTTSYQTFFSYSASSSYANNFFRLQALCNCSGANNATGTATSVTFKISWIDNYNDPDGVITFAPTDTVNGTLTVAVGELKATGPLIPSGIFTITSPSYSLSSITAS